MKPKYKSRSLVRTTDNKKISIGYTTIWSYTLYTIAQIIKDTIPSYPIIFLPERCNEIMLSKTDLTMDEIDEVI